MRLLVDCTPLHSGGGIQVAIAFLENLQHHEGITWHAIAPEHLQTMLAGPLKSSPHISITHKRGLLDILKMKNRLKRAERSFSPDVVFTVFGPSYFRAQAPHLVGFAIPDMIYKPHTRMPLALKLKYWLTDTLRIQSLCKADHLVVETQTVLERLAQRAKIDDSQISVIGNSLNPILAKYQPTGVPQKGSFKILIPSAYYPHKNLEVVPSVAQALMRLAPDLDFQFRFTLEESGPGWRLILEHAKALGVAERVMTYGPLTLNHLAKAYQTTSAVFLPTLREASTAVYPESFYFKRPLITSDVDFAHELCGDAALYIPPTDPPAIAKSLHTLITTPALASQLVEKGEQQLRCTYPTPQQKFDLQLKALRELANKNTGAACAE